MTKSEKPFRGIVFPEGLSSSLDGRQWIILESVIESAGLNAEFTILVHWSKQVALSWLIL